MKTLKICIVVILLAVTGNTFAQTLTASKPGTLTAAQISQGQSELINGMVSFVESVRPFYAKGDTYEAFKYKALVGDQTVAIKTALPTTPTITIEGEAMLKKAYLYLSKGYSAIKIAKVDNGKTFGEAMVFMYEYHTKNAKSSISADVALFGGNQNALDNNPTAKATKGNCKWWQLACHINSIFGETVGPVITEALGTLIRDLLKGIN